MADLAPGAIHVGGNVQGSILVTGSHNIIIQAGQVLLQTAQAAQAQGRDPTHMLRILAVLAAPVHDPDHPQHLPPPLDLQQEWHELAQGVRERGAPILLARIVPPTLDALRSALSPRAEAQAIFPHILHFSGHAWKGGLLLEDEYGQVHRATTDDILGALRGLPRPLDLVVLNGCESAAEARSVAQALVNAGLARAAVGHIRPVSDPAAVRFAARLYAELADGFSLREAMERARQKMMHPARASDQTPLLLGDADLRFERFTGGAPWIDDRRPRGNLPPRPGLFFGRGPQLVEIARALAHPPRVVLLSGPAAIGKTTLALEAAHRNAYRFPGGVAFAEGPRPEAGRSGAAAELLLQLAAGLRIEATPDDVGEKLAEHTRLDPTLLLLDNLESLPPEEMDRLCAFLNRLGPESAAIALARAPQAQLQDLPRACSIALHEGIGSDAATRYVFRLAQEKNIPLGLRQAGEIVQATDGHPRLVELIVAQAHRRDLKELLREVQERRGDFAKQLETVYDWSARLLEEKGQGGAWQALLLFPAGRAPEGLLWAAAKQEGAEALRAAALADFAPQLQAWRWHGSVAEYARLRRPLGEDERRARLAALLPAWTAWLEDLPSETPETASRLEVQQDNLAALLAEAPCLPKEPLQALLRALDKALPAPDETLTLRPFEEAVYRTWAGLATEKAERAQALNMLGYALAALGRRAEALAATQEAVEIRRALARANPQAFRPDLAGSLNNLGIRLSDLGRREEALAATQEAAALYRQLAAAHPQAFRSDLAGSLANLGNRLSEVGRREEALAATQEAADLYRALARENPQAFRPYLAASLNNLGRDLSALGQREEALAATQEAADLYRALARENPQAFRPYLAASLNNLGRALSALGRREEALAATQEAVEIRRALARENPQAFLPDLARSLNNLGNRLSELGRREEALAATQEAVEHYRQLARENPQAFLPDLARSLLSHGIVLLFLDRAREARDAFEEGLRAIQPFAQAYPDAFGDLAAALREDYHQACQRVAEEE